MKIKKIRGNLWNLWQHTIWNLFPCGYCGRRNLEIKNEVNGTWCHNCNLYIR